jgi:CMP/dCMP kinase
MKKGFAIAIDGPVASGKGTLAPNLAKKLKGFYLDTGAMYRCVGLYVIQQGIDPYNKDVIEKLTRELIIEFDKGKTFMDKVDVSEKIRTSDVSRAASTVAGYRGVRQELIKKQKNIAEEVLKSGSIVILEGRDIATVVLPNAEFKLYLTATPEVRAKRRQAQLAEQGESVDFNTVLTDTNERDRKDMENKTLVKHPNKHGYTVLDNSEFSQGETLKTCFELLQKKGLINDSL